MYELLTDKDIDSIERITNRKFERIDHPFIWSHQKYIDDVKLNEKGLHLIRILVAWRKYVGRFQEMDDDIKKFIEKGFLLKENVGEKEAISIVKKLSGIKNAHIHKILDYHVIHKVGERQYALHSDAFHSTIKAWLIKEPVIIEQGPFYYCDGSHNISFNRLRWDYHCSLNPKITLEKENMKPTGAFRIHNSADNRKESFLLHKYGFKEPKPLLGDIGTCLFANTRGLHKRGKAEPGTKRYYRSIQYRPHPFQ